MNVDQFAQELAGVLAQLDGVGIGKATTTISLSAVTLYWFDGGVTPVQIQSHAEQNGHEPMAKLIARCMREVIEAEPMRELILARYRVQVDSNGGAMIAT